MINFFMCIIFTVKIYAIPTFVIFYCSPTTRSLVNLKTLALIDNIISSLLFSQYDIYVKFLKRLFLIQGIISFNKDSLLIALIVLSISTTFNLGLLFSFPFELLSGVNLINEAALQLSLHQLFCYT